ncbi:S9 family peptidase [Sphingomonas baiyangensis]|uniref:Acyl-peptide hydrolase n=1 Tax=Sphingomonas baiyangensis TaxID=2572576 RepID=A0A4V5PTU8_9SPHN|nr:S9 family peptidase [Sphingomonas baiyangensis]TKD51388.1 S9 family peptidase [Sphingomonas baiyangensis]
MRLIALPALLLATSALAQEAATHRPEDVVKAEAVSLAPGATAADDVSRYLLVRSPRGAVALAGGERVAYTSDVTGRPQIWVMPAGGGQADQISYGSGVAWVRPAPDGGILYGADTDGDERVGMYWIGADGMGERTVIAKSPAYRQFGDWSGDGKRFLYASTERNNTDFDIWVADLAGGAPRLVLEANGTSYYPLAWQPGGELVILSEVRGSDANNLHLLNVATGERRALLVPKEAAEHSGVTWAPDGKGFYLAHNGASDTHRLAYFDLASGQLRTLADPKLDIAGVELSDDGRYLAWTTIETGFNRLHVRDLQTGRDVALPELPAGLVGLRAVKGGGSKMLLSLNTPQTAGETHIWDPAAPSTPPVRILKADTPGLDLAQMVTPEPVAFKARDGAPLTGLLYMPRNLPAGAKPPVFIEVHGGPSAHAVPAFAPDIQYYVARGIAVLDFNYRGSTGQGKAFAALNDRENKVNEVGDLADAVAWLRQSGKVDGSRIAVGGGSYGGYLTNLALGTYPDMFVGGVSAVGVSDWVAALEGASPSLKAADKLEFGDISDPKVRAFFAKLSPINNVARIKTPMMVLHGANDPRDPVSESDRLVAGIRANGGTVTYLRFPDEGHGITKVNNRVHAYRRVADFLEQRFGMQREAAGSASR